MLDLHLDNEIIEALEAVEARYALNMSDPVEREIALWREANDRIFEYCQNLELVTLSVYQKGAL